MMSYEFYTLMRDRDRIMYSIIDGKSVKLTTSKITKKYPENTSLSIHKNTIPTYAFKIYSVWTHAHKQTATQKNGHMHTTHGNKNTAKTPQNIMKIW